MNEILLFFSFILFFSLLLATTQYRCLERAPRSTKCPPFTLLDFADSLHGCLFSQNGDYVTTTNGGISWSAVKKLQDCTKIVKVSLLNRNVMIAVDELSISLPVAVKLHITKNFGSNWSEGFLPDSVIKRGGGTISLLYDSIIGFLGWKGSLYKSANLGANWDTLFRPEPELFSTLSIFDSSDFLICGGGGSTLDGFVRRSTDGGKTWNDLFNITQLATADAEYYTNSLGYILQTYGDEPVRMRTILFNPRTNESIIFNDSRYYGALYDNGEYFLLSISYGLYKIGSDSSYDLGPWQSGDVKIKQFTTVGREYAWILSDSGRLFQRTDLLTGVQNNKSIQIPEKFIVINAYPNPFNASCIVETQTNLSLLNTLILIYDVLGRRQKTLYEGYLFSGRHQFRWDGKNNNGTNVASGVYFLFLYTTHGNYVKQLLYLK